MCDATIKDPNVKNVSNTIKARYDCGIENQKSVGCMVLEPVICRSVGRDPDNPSNREKGCNTEQTLELKKDGCSNTLTTVQKDNMVLEPKIKNIGSINGHQSGNVLHHDSDLSPCLCVAGHVAPQKIMVKKDNWVIEPINPHEDGTARTLKAQYFKNSVANFEKTGTYGATGVTVWGKNKQVDTNSYLRIRKLTPKECWRLMGFSDEDFDKVKGISNTQLYKQAGNSIVVNVLEAIFKQLFKENHK